MLETSNEKGLKIKLISKCFLKPTINLANNAPKKPIYLGGTDVFMLTMDTMQRGLLFNTKLQADTLRRLEISLYVALVHFYPLAGRFATKKFEDEHCCCFYLDCEAGPGARLIHAAADYAVSDILSSVDVHPIVDFFFDMREKSINYDGHTSPLLSVQVTELNDGVAIGVTMNHCVADGNSLWHFISTLSEIFNQIKDDDENNNDIEKSSINAFHKVTVSRKPICETLFPNVGHGPRFKIPYLEPDEFIIRYDPSPVRVRMFHFSTQSVSTLKAQANKQCGLQNKISSFQALSALMWRSIMRARNLEPDHEVRCTVMMNARTRFNPPLPLEYFRCLLSAAASVTKMRDLMSDNLGQIALLVHQSITEQDEKYYRRLVQYMEDQPSIIQHGPGSINNITFSGSTRSNIYGSEFGLGKAVAALAGYANKDDGKVTASPGRAGDGSVDLEVCLRPETMNALELDPEFMSYVSM
ncbi:hypothetical protein vseg_006893 [Gypsophila vaccaria]